MSDQHKRKRDTTAAEANKRTRPADEGIVFCMEDIPADWLQAPVAKSRNAIAEAGKRDFRPFAVYRIAGVDLDLEELIHTRLSKGRFGSVEAWRAMVYTAARVSDIYAFHIKQQDLNQQFVAIADDRDIARRGLILININYKGTPDAIRQKAHAIGEFISFELIDHDDDYAEAWSDHVIHRTSTTLFPLRSFAVFVAKNCVDSEMVSNELDLALACDEHTGWNSRHRDFPSVLAQWEMVTTSPSTQHEQWRIEKDWNEDYYVVVGNGLMDYSEVEIVSVKSKKRWSWSISNFCEVLHYLTIGLITEEELSSPWRTQPELLRALSPGWLQGFQDDIAAAGDIEDSDSDSGDDDKVARELLATGYDPDDDAAELPSMPVWV